MKHISKAFLGLLIGAGLSCAMEQPERSNAIVGSSLALDYSSVVEVQSSPSAPSFIDPLAQYRDLIENHSRKRFGKGSLPCPRGCPNTFKSRATVRQHIRDRHGQSDLYICDICQESCAAERYLKKHITDCHGEPNLYICDICQKSFTVARYLKAHTKRCRSKNI